MCFYYCNLLSQKLSFTYLLLLIYLLTITPWTFSPWTFVTPEISFIFELVTKNQICNLTKLLNDKTKSMKELYDNCVKVSFPSLCTKALITI